jgi:hypothetical protein
MTHPRARGRWGERSYNCPQHPPKLVQRAVRRRRRRRRTTRRRRRRKRRRKRNHPVRRKRKNQKNQLQNQSSPLQRLIINPE